MNRIGAITGTILAGTLLSRSVSAARARYGTRGAAHSMRYAQKCSYRVCVVFVAKHSSPRIVP